MHEELAGTGGGPVSAAKGIARRRLGCDEGFLRSCPSSPGAPCARYQDKGTGRTRHLGGNTGADRVRRLFMPSCVRTRAPLRGDEVMETMGNGHVPMGAGPSVMYAAQAVEAYDQYATKHRVGRNLSVHSTQQETAMDPNVGTETASSVCSLAWACCPYSLFWTATQGGSD